MHNSSKTIQEMRLQLLNVSTAIGVTVLACLIIIIVAYGSTFSL